MIYVLTVHWKSDAWIELQQRFLQRNIQSPFRHFAYLNGIDRKYYMRFDHVLDHADPTHAQKLDALADVVSHSEALDSDLLIFMDGDAFPVNSIDVWLNELLIQYPLLAVQRKENLGDIQPHPCFCATTVGFWRKYHPTWQEGETWINDAGVQTTDVGAGILRCVRENHLTWKPLLRSNHVNLHPVFFALYEDMIYHHGAGFRNEKLTRKELTEKVYPKRTSTFARFLKKVIPNSLKAWILKTISNPVAHASSKLSAENSRHSDRIYQQLLDNPEQVFIRLRGR